ncbi:NUDIX hydrolase [Pseudorhodobacter antarcticus]|jgi:8-oxo-dGTP pyrophosphatase MutT (NUDIX family)|nr:NUDIX hydrolase [Pseudorhodobacter antarcticus]
MGFISQLFYRPPILQVAALCWRGTGDGVEILLVRSLDSNRWILPKGWPMRGKTLAQAAAIEAWEEAGVEGQISPHSIGIYATQKRRATGIKQACQMHVYALHVSDVVLDFPEADMRKTAWFPLFEALEKLREPDLAAMIAVHLAPDP